MKKIAGLVVVSSFFFSSALMALAAGSTPAGGACTATSDCATGLVCGADPGGGFRTICGTAASFGGSAPASGATAAGDGSQVTRTSLQNPIRFNNFYDFVREVLRVAVEILMPFVVLAFIWSGFLFVRAQGNPTELEKAKSAIYWSVIGAFILMGAWGFAQIIGTTVSTLTQ